MNEWVGGVAWQFCRGQPWKSWSLKLGETVGGGQQFGKRAPAEGKKGDRRPLFQL